MWIIGNNIGYRIDTMKNKHLIVVSVDALVYEDLEYAKTLPAFGKILKDCALIEKVLTIYPSLTHPVHASIMTGCPAGTTGIVSNTVFRPGDTNPPWYNFLSQVKCETIFHTAHRAGLTTAACRWPVTAGGGDVIDYLVPEMLELDIKGYEDNPIEAYKRLGSGENILDILEVALEKYGCTNEHPEYDEFEIYCASEIIKRYKPNVLFTHPGYVDSTRHMTGLFSDQVKKSIKETDKWLLMLLEAIADAGIENETDLVIISDHGHLNISRVVCPNVYLKDAGFIKTDSNGNITEWDAYITGGGLSAQVYLKNCDDKLLYDKVYSFLNDMADKKLYGFRKVFTADEVKEKYGFYGEFSFVLETDGYTSFADNWMGDCVSSLDKDGYFLGSSSHGHMPEKGPQPVFIGSGPSFRAGVIVPQGHILNHAPTLAKILGIELQNASGKAEDKILK